MGVWDSWYFDKGQETRVKMQSPDTQGVSQHAGFVGVANKLRVLKTCSWRVSRFRFDFGGGLRIEGRGLRLTWLRLAS